MVDMKPNPIDVHVGQRLRQRRVLAGLSQEKLARMVGITFQQVQKYERGANRIGASRLFDLSRVLDVPVGFFFEEMTPEFAAGFMARMRPDTAAAVMAGLEPATAYSISVVIAGRNARVPTE